MGPIQASLNQLTLSALGAVAGIAKGLKGMPTPQGQQPKAPAVKGVKSETAALEKKPVKTGFTTEEAAQLLTARLGKRGYNKYASGLAAIQAVDSANDMIYQKASANFSVADRLSKVGGKK